MNGIFVRPGPSARNPRFGRRGVTLPELAIYLLLLGVAVQILVAPARRQADRIAVNAAREEVIALLHRARMEARVSGEARVVIVEGADPVLLRPGTSTPVGVDLAVRGVHLDVAGSRTLVELAYGPLGVAQFAPASLVLRRGKAEAAIVVSGYGRVRR